MSKKRKARELAMQVLFLWDTNGDNNDVVAAQVVNDGTDDDEVRRDALTTAAAAWNGRAVADDWVVRLDTQIRATNPAQPRAAIKKASGRDNSTARSIRSFPRTEPYEPAP